MTNRLTFLGHSTLLIDVAGVRVLTDPVFGTQVAHLRRHVPAPVVPEALDAVVISHQHRDHLDMASLRRLEAPVLAPSAASLKRLKQPVIEVRPGDVHRYGDVAVHVVEAAHDGRRDLRAAETPAVGYVVDWGPRLYFAGDTELFDGLDALAPVDYALLPIWGWGPSLGPGHMDPEQAAEAAARLRAGVVVPIHWGTFLPIGLRRRYGNLLRDPADTFVAHMAELAPATRVEILDPGDTLDLA